MRSNRSSSGQTISLNWMKSSLSLVNGNCVEVVELSSGLILVRDSKNPQGPWLQFSPAEWDAFLGGVRNGEFDRHPGHAA